jgi:AraC family transcriptional regulator, ethanolamine operon transcriptional activator
MPSGCEMDRERNAPPDRTCASVQTQPHDDVDAPAVSAMRREKPPAFVATTIVRFESNDPDEFCERVTDWDGTWTQLHAGAFRGSAQIIPLGPVLVATGCINIPMMQHDWAPRDCVTLGRPGRRSAPVVYRGHDIEDGEVFVGGRDAEVEIVNRGVHYSSTLSVRFDLLEREADWLVHLAPLTAINGVALRAPGLAWTNSFLDAIEWIVDAVERYPEALARRDMCGSLIDSLLTRVNTLAAADAPIHRDRQMRAHRRLAVERAREYIARNLTDPIRLSDLSRHAHTQARSLEYGFQEVLGVSPMAYVRATRLHRAHRLLRTSAVRTRSISEIALDSGFWHLSQFAADYKLLFGESPSVTFRRTEAQLPRSERRRQVSMKPSIGMGKATTGSACIAAALS